MKIKNQTVKRNFFTLKSMAIMICICLCSLLYVWQHIMIIKLGYLIKTNEIKLSNLTDEKDRLDSIISRLESPGNIEKLLADANIKLQYSKNPNVVRVKM